MMMCMEGSTSHKPATIILHKEWDNICCPICMDSPHNAVLLLCTSHGNGCRSYICDTSHRHSNCLDRFRKLKDESGSTEMEESFGNRGSGSIRGNELGLESLRCPLCRGKVVGLMIIKEVRQYLDSKSRVCSRETCSFLGDYKELRRHARRAHPRTRPGDADPSRQHAWHRLEHQREYGDILSAISSAMPGAIVVGDYAIDYGNELSLARGSEEDVGGRGGPWWTAFFPFHMLDGAEAGESINERRGVVVGNSRASRPSPRRRYVWGENLVGLHDGDEGDDAPVPRRRRRLTRFRPNDEEHHHHQ